MNKPGQPTTQQTLIAWFNQLGPEELVRPEQAAKATGLLLITVEDTLRALARSGQIGKKRKGRTPYYCRAPITTEKASRRFCFDLAAKYSYRSYSA